MEAYAGPQFVGIDLHRRRSVMLRMTAAGEVLETTRIVNAADRLAAVWRRAGESPEVVRRWSGGRGGEDLRLGAAKATSDDAWADARAPGIRDAANVVRSVSGTGGGWLAVAA